MLKLDNTRDRIIAAAMRLAEKSGWNGLSLGAIAGEAETPLHELRREFKSKADILAAFSRVADDAVLAQYRPSPADSPRDRLFDVIITRFEIMQPYRNALRRIRSDLRMQPSAALRQFGVASRSQYWMMQAAGINPEGGRGFIRLKGLMAIYADVFSTWLDDDDPGMARTMAVLDKRLRRGEDFIRRVEGFCDGIGNLFRSMRRRRSGREDDVAPSGETPPPTPPPPPPPDAAPGPTPSQF